MKAKLKYGSWVYKGKRYSAGEIIDFDEKVAKQLKELNDPQLEWLKEEKKSYEPKRKKRKR